MLCKTSSIKSQHKNGIKYFITFFTYAGRYNVLCAMLCIPIIINPQMVNKITISVGKRSMSNTYKNRSTNKSPSFSFVFLIFISLSFRVYIHLGYLLPTPLFSFACCLHIVNTLTTSSMLYAGFSLPYVTPVYFCVFLQNKFDFLRYSSI